MYICDMKEESYPENFIEFLEQFEDEESCRKYLFELKWVEGFRCLKWCNNIYGLTDQNLIHCKECIGRQIGRVRFRCTDEASSKKLIPFVKDNMAQGATTITDGWTGCKLLQNDSDYNHEVKVISDSGKEVHEPLPHVHTVDSLVKRWLNSTFQGKLSPEYLLYYLDEFAFRLNRKTSTFRGNLFYILMQHTVDVELVGLNDIVDK